MVWDDGLKDHRSKWQLCCHQERGLARERAEESKGDSQPALWRKAPGETGSARMDGPVSVERFV